jgi:hypothetical protein
MAALRNGIQAKTIREGRQNIRIWVPSMQAGVRQTSAQNGGCMRGWRRLVDHIV